MSTRLGILNIDTNVRSVTLFSFVLTLILLLFSGHCKKLTPEYAGAAKILGEKTPPRYLAKVDTTKEEKLGKRFDIKGFPTLKWFV